MAERSSFVVVANRLPVDEVMVDRDVIEGRKEPVRVYAKKEKTGSGAA